ncbi:MAG: PQQ-binding-like beta-propeller repeat protein [bacterium]|nr:PQQ-binding-like beta-propeller repeat protein [bacterium]
MKYPLATLVLCAGCALNSHGNSGLDDDTGANWPSYHGEFGRGFADGYPTPTRWDIETGENIAWSTPIPGLSHSSPVVWGNRVFVNTAVKEGGGDAELKVGLYGDIQPVKDDSVHEFRLLCLDRRSGDVTWSRTPFKGVPAVKRHPKGSHAASTPATDGRFVATFFGTEGLFVYTVDGELVWQKEFGMLDSGFFRVPDAQWGWASSPVIHDGRVYIQADAQKGSFVAAFDVATGQQIWRKDREEVPTWCTPTVHISDGRRQLVLNGWKHIGGYDLDTGNELWKVESTGDIPVPTPVAAHGLLFFTSAHGGPSRILAVSEDAEGEFTVEADGKNMVWSSRRFGAYMQSPFVYGDELYVCRDNGVVTCWDAKTGNQHYRQRLTAGMGYTSSGVAADGKLYYSSEEGDVHVVKAGKEYELLAVNEFGETVMATPAVAHGMLLYRTRTKLVAIASPTDPATAPD